MKLENPRLLRTQAYIDGTWTVSSSAETFDVINPYDGKLLARVADATKEDTKRAIIAAQTAQVLWKKYTAEERSNILRKWHDLQLEYLDDLAMILTHEQGKPFEEAKAEIKYGASFVAWFAEEARRVYGDIVPGHQLDKRILVLKQPIGVIAAITPWNFPNAMITRKVAPALAAGCTCVVKPAKLTPLSANALAVLGEEAGIPKGVINIITTSQSEEVGEELTTNPIVKKLSFTGSTKVGKLLMEKCASTVKKVSMELGGNAPFIVFDDADLDKAVAGALVSKYRNAGQTCVCANRLFVQAGVYDTFIQKLKTKLAILKVGNGMEENTDIGPLIEEKAIDFVETLIKDALNKGGKIEIGGQRYEAGTLLYQPTIISRATADMRLFSEEIFGPVAPIFKFHTEEEVIALANRTSYGLASYFYGNDNRRIWRVAEALDYGMIGINTGHISTTLAPFGGVKESGIGREGSKYGIEEYIEMKYLCMDIS